MAFSFSKEFTANTFTCVENAFISQYLPVSSGNAVKVYLFGLYLCNKPNDDTSLETMASTLDISQDDVKNLLLYWEEFGLLNIISFEPLNVSYLPIKIQSNAKPRKFKAEKYSEFSKSLQALLPSRMISTSEFSEYFFIMESYKILPEAMLLIVKYCIDKKGNEISYKYVSKVASDFGERGINTIEKVEKELSSYVLKTSVLEKILSAMSIRRKPEIEDLNYLKKWTSELNFEVENIIYAAKQLKKGNIQKLDSFILELYSLKCFSKDEIKAYKASKQEVYDLTIKINRALSIYVEVIDTEIETYINKWVSYGFLEDALLFVASNQFKTGKKTLEDMDQTVEYLRTRGFISLSSISDYYEDLAKQDEFIKKLLNIFGFSRNPNPWDRENIATWKSWNFTEEMILEAAKLSIGKSSPIAYTSGILSNWKNNNIFSPESILCDQQTKNEKITIEEYNLEYKRRRTLAITKAQKNMEKAQSLEGFTALYERNFEIEKDLAFAEISGNKEALISLENEKTEVLKSLEKLLSSIGLTLSCLIPQYACEKCNDTGYIGSDRCDCFDKKIK